MADELDVQEQEAPQKKKGGKLKWIIIAVLILAIGGAAFFFKDTILGMVGMGGEPEAGQEEAAAPEDTVMPEGVTGEMVSIPAFVANLQDPLGRRYIKLGVEVELRDEKAIEDFNAKEIQIKDMMIRLLGGKKPQEMLGQQNQVELKQEIVNRLNQILGPGKVLNIYFSEYILQ